MIKQIINIKRYWRVIVYYDIDYNFFDTIVNDLIANGCSYYSIDDIYYNMIKSAKAFTYSNIEKHVSIVGFNKHNDKYDYLNSIVHEAEHIKQHMLKAYRVDDSGEPPAYTVGYLVMMMLKTKSVSH